MGEQSNAEKLVQQQSPSRKGLIYIALVLGIIVGWFILTSSSPQETVIENIASVNGEAIRLEEFNTDYDFFLFITGLPEEAVNRESFLEQTIAQTLLLQQAKKQGLSVSDEEIEKKLTAALKKARITRDEFEKRLKSSGFSIEQLKSYYKKQLTIEAFLKDTIGEISNSEEETESFYEEYKDQMLETAVEILKDSASIETY